MAKLYFKQKVFKITDHYPVFDENKQEVYHVDQDFTFFGARIHVNDALMQPVFRIEKRIFVFLPQFTLYFNNGDEITVKSRFTFFRKVIDIVSHHYHLVLKGDFFSLNFDIYEHNTLIGHINCKFLTWGDTFEIEVVEKKYQDILVGLAIAVDNLIDSDAQNTSYVQSSNF